MSPRDRLHQLVDELPDAEVQRAELVLLALADAAAPYTPLDEAPLDDEPETEEERRGVAEALRDIAEGRLLPLEDLERDLGSR